MNATLFSLIAVTVGFAALVLWVYWPSRRERLEALGQIPLEHEASPSEAEKTAEVDQ